MILLFLTLYFGSTNNVHAELKTVKTKYFRFELHSGRDLLLQDIIQNCDKWYADMASNLGVKPEKNITILAADSYDEFIKFQSYEGARVEWAVGIAFPEQKTIIIRLDKNYLFTLKQTFLHEINHILLLQGKMKKFFPAWFTEGVAIYFSGEGVWSRLDVAIKAASINSMVPLEQITFHFPTSSRELHLAYAESGLFVRYLIKEYGKNKLIKLIQSVRQSGKFFTNFLHIYGLDAQSAFLKWSKTLKDSSSILIFFNDGTIMWFAMTIIFILGYIKIIRKRKKRLQAMQEQEDNDSFYN